MARKTTKKQKSSKKPKLDSTARLERKVARELLATLELLKAKQRPAQPMSPAALKFCKYVGYDPTASEEPKKSTALPAEWHPEADHAVFDWSEQEVQEYGLAHVAQRTLQTALQAHQPPKGSWLRTHPAGDWLRLRGR
jgi:hypothetical protein